MFRRRSRDTPDDDPVRRAAQYRVDREITREDAERDDEAPPGGTRRVRPEDRAMYVDTVIDQAVRRVRGWPALPHQRARAVYDEAKRYADEITMAYNRPDS